MRMTVDEAERRARERKQALLKQTGPVVYDPDASEGMTPTEAEELARRRRVELGLSSPDNEDASFEALVQQLMSQGLERFEAEFLAQQVLAARDEQPETEPVKIAIADLYTDDLDLTPAQAEALARQRREELGISTNPADLVV